MPETDEISKALILVASLPDEDARRRGVRENLGRSDLPFAIVDSIDGRRWGDEEVSGHLSEELNGLRLRVNQRGGVWLASGAIACALTHRDGLLANVIEDGRILCEDDIHFEPDFMDLLARGDALEALSAINDGVVLLNYRAQGRHLAAEKSPVARFGRYSIHKVVGRVASGAAYFVSPDVAQKIVAYQTPLRVSADSWTTMKEAGVFSEIYLVHPLPVGTGMYPTSINYYGDRKPSGFFAYLQRSSWLRRLRWVLLRAKGTFTEHVTDWQ